MVDVPAAPFTAATLKEILVGTNGVLRGSQIAPATADLDRLAKKLNWFRRLFGDMLEVGNAGRSVRDDARQAVDTLDTYFALRRRMCESGPYKPLSQETLSAESRLADKYDCFRTALCDHEFKLAIDNFIIPQMSGWHDLAELIADNFNYAMQQSSGQNEFGRSSNTGPIPRFVAAVIPQITGETPSVETVGQHLKRRAKLDTVK